VDEPGQLLAALSLLIAANAGAWLVSRLLGDRWAAPMDFGMLAPDGQPLLGSHKTWRGFAGGVLASGVVSWAWGLGVWTGLGVAALSLVGDALSSALKRRLRLAPGREIPLLDQVPEALLPLVAFRRALGLDPVGTAIVVVTFVVLDVASARARLTRPEAP
jgi:CDP-2,3-bis-(O-geranylgeranyl)-sn-glycerol synthase